MLTFFLLLSGHLPWYLACLTVVVICVYLLMRRHFFSVIDPLFYMLILNETFCIADVLFMFRFGMIDTRITVNFILTESALLIGILQFGVITRPTPPALLNVKGKPPLALRVLYGLSLVLFIALHLFVYVERGIPAFQISRLNTYGEHGWGILDRLFDVLFVIILYYLMDVLRSRRWNFLEWGSFLSLVAIQILGGSKMAVLILLGMAGLASYFIGNSKTYFSLRSKYMRIGVLLVIVGALITTTLESYGANKPKQQLSTLAKLTVRFVSSGDALIYAYPNGSIEALNGRNPLKAVLKEYLSTFRIVPPDELPVHIGTQIVERFGGNGNFMTDANHNIFGYVYFGFWGSILYSYLVGTTIGFVRYPLRRRLPRNWVGGIIFTLLSFSSIWGVSQPDEVPRYLIDILVIFIPLVFLASVLATALRSSSGASRGARDGLSEGHGQPLRLIT